MVNSLADILSDKWDEPPEIKMIKEFARERFKEDVAVSIGPRQISIHVASSAFAGTLRMHIYELQQKLKSDKKLVIRIG